MRVEAGLGVRILRRVGTGAERQDDAERGEKSRASCTFPRGETM
jgi:hypothetical protein